MRNVKLTIEYDGTNYCGWQKQNNEKTIQEEIEKAIYKQENTRTMKKIYILTLLLCFISFGNSFAQTLKGHIYDAKNELLS